MCVPATYLVQKKHSTFAERPLAYDLQKVCTIIPSAKLTVLLQKLEIFDKWQNPFFFFFLPSQNFLREILSLL